jgi:hypothetical protein
MAVSKGLWPFVQRQEKLFRCYQISLRRKSQDLGQILSRLDTGRIATLAPPPVPSPTQHVDTLIGVSLAASDAASDTSPSSRASSIDFSSVPESFRPRSRRARWSRRLLVAVVLGSHVMSIITGR